MQVDWSALAFPNDGDSSILSYNLVWDAGSGTTNQNLVGLASNYLSTTYSITSGITSGTTYSFKVRALNIYGWSSAYSAIATITASDVPSQMAILTTSLSTTFVRFTWTAPASNGDAIDAY